MIKASEAKANVEKYIQTAIEASLADIEKLIIEESEQGRMLTRAVYDENNDSRILSEVISVLETNGYQVENRAQFKYLLIQWG